MTRSSQDGLFTILRRVYSRMDTMISARRGKRMIVTRVCGPLLAARYSALSGGPVGGADIVTRDEANPTSAEVTERYVERSKTWRLQEGKDCGWDQMYIQRRGAEMFERPPTLGYSMIIKYGSLSRIRGWYARYCRSLVPSQGCRGLFDARFRIPVYAARHGKVASQRERINILV